MTESVHNGKVLTERHQLRQVSLAAANDHRLAVSRRLEQLEVCRDVTVGLRAKPAQDRNGSEETAYWLRVWSTDRMDVSEVSDRKRIKER